MSKLVAFASLTQAMKKKVTGQGNFLSEMEILVPASLACPKVKLTTGSNLRLRAIDRVVKEIGKPLDYLVEILPVKTGRRFTHVES